MSEKIIITSDSTTDLSPEMLRDYGIKLLHLGITLQEQTYKDGLEIDPEFIYQQYEAHGILPKTAAPNLEQCLDFFRPLVEDGYSVVHFTISAEMSSTYQNCLLAGEELGNVHVVDTRNLSTGGGLLVVAACEMVKAGEKTAAEIAQACRDLAPYVDASFVIDSLEFLHKGGRCSAVAALGANLLKLKPCIVVRNGNMSVGKKYRGAFSAVLKKYIDDMIGDASDIDCSRIFITHAGCDDTVVAQCAEQVKAYGKFETIHITRAGCTVSSHCGRNTLGVLFIRKHPVTE